MAESAGFTRRHFLTVATVVTGGVGAIATAVPFVSSFKPSARAQALGAPVEVDVSKLELGAMSKVEWRGRPIYIVRRSDEMLGALEERRRAAARPRFRRTPSSPRTPRTSIAACGPSILVLEGVCTHLGCAPMPRFEVAPADLGPTWPGGFYCPCHGSKFDLAGRVFAGVPAPRICRCRRTASSTTARS